MGPSKKVLQIKCNIKNEHKAQICTLSPQTSYFKTFFIKLLKKFERCPSLNKSISMCMAKSSMTGYIELHHVLEKK